MACAGRQDLQLQGHVGRHFPGRLYRMFQESWRVLGTSQRLSLLGSQKENLNDAFPEARTPRLLGPSPKYCPSALPPSLTPPHRPRGRKQPGGSWLKIF